MAALSGLHIARVQSVAWNVGAGVTGWCHGLIPATHLVGACLAGRVRDPGARDSLGDARNQRRRPSHLPINVF